MKILKSLNKVMKLLKPPPKLTLSEWSDIYRMLTSESSAEAGRWQTSRAPYQKEIMDAVSNPEVEKVVVMSSSQVGKTEIILNTISDAFLQDALTSYAAIALCVENALFFPLAPY